MIEVKNLAKHFKLPKKRKTLPTAADVREVNSWFQAVRNVSFHCESGEVLGLLGPNGAGKTTSLRMLSTALVPTSGSVSVDGVDLVANPKEARRKFGFLSGATGLYGRLTVRENVRFFGEAHGMSRTALDARVNDLFNRLDMQSYADRRAETLSAGMRQRALIARTVVHSPSVLILDEPTTGLDILGAQIVTDFIRECQRDGMAIVFSTHHLHEVEALCQRVCIIDTGENVFDGSLAALAELGNGKLAQGYLSCLKHVPASFNLRAA